MEVQVLYADRNIFTGEVEWFDHMATVDAPTDNVKTAMEFAFRRLQNLDGSWSMGPNVDYCDNPDYHEAVQVLKPLNRGVRGQEIGHRSCSVFDRMIVDGKIYEVASFGFNEIK